MEISVKVGGGGSTPFFELWNLWEVLILLSHIFQPVLTVLLNERGGGGWEGENCNLELAKNYLSSKKIKKKN